MPTNIYQRAALAAAISACFPALALGAGVARVDFAVGNVTATSPDGRSRTLARGAEIDVGETVATQQGRAQLRFSDGAYMSLQPQTEFKVEEFKYSGKAQESDNIVMNLLKGGMRTITGLIGRTNRNNYRLRTDVATIGIRGTEFSVKYTNSIEVFCADGSIFVQNEGGSLQLNGGQGGYVANNQTPPQRTDERPVLPPQSVGPNQEIEEKPDDPVNPIQEAFPPVTQTVLTGTASYNMAFVNYDHCGDGCTNPVFFLETTATLDAEGNLISFSDNGTVTNGTASVVGQGNDGTIAWGRWVSGTLGGDGTGSGTGLSGEDLHYVVGIPVANMPMTGSATYNMIGSTIPSLSGGNISSASVTSSLLAVDFAWNAAKVEIGLTLNGSTNVAVATNPFSPMAVSGGGFSGFVSGGGCTGGSVNGFLAGDGATRAGLTYHISVSENVFGTVSGAIAYQRGDLGPSSSTNPFQQQLLLRDAQ